MRDIWGFGERVFLGFLQGIEKAKDFVIGTAFETGMRSARRMKTAAMINGDSHPPNLAANAKTAT